MPPVPLTKAQLEYLYGKKLALAATQDKVKRDHCTDNFDKAALFLLSLNYVNLFEPMFDERTRYSGDPVLFRCKGCYQKSVKRIDREAHYIEHKRELVNATD